MHRLRFSAIALTVISTFSAAARAEQGAPPDLLPRDRQGCLISCEQATGE